MEDYKGVPMDRETESRTRLLAYELWDAAGRPKDSSLRFWAEAELLVAAVDKASEPYRQRRIDPKR